MALFIHREIKTKNGLQKLFNSKDEDAFLVELENLFADYENSLDSLSMSNVKNLAAKYNISLENDCFDERKELLFRLLTKTLSDDCINELEYRQLKHFCNILGLASSILDEEITKRATEIYRNKLVAFFTDKYISADERSQLEQLKKNLRLDDSIAKNIYREAVKSTMDSYTKPIFESQVFSPQDEDRMYTAAKNLGLSLTFPPEIQAKLVKYRQNWEILNGKLPVLQSDLHLQSGDVLHHVQQVNWYEERTETRRVNYSGLTYNTRLIGNLKWKTGSISPQKITQDIWKIIDSGHVLLTSKRIVFTGQHGNKVIPYSKILHFEPYANGIMIQKDSGKSPFFEFNTDVPIFAEILNQLLRRN